MAILESGEMYVEAIYLLSLESDKIRGKDISDYMGFSRPSVSRALNSLMEKGLVRKDKNGFIRLTRGGIILAKYIYERHSIIAAHGKQEDPVRHGTTSVQQHKEIKP